MSSPQQVIINSTITPNMTFTKTSQKFGQWADSRANTVFGLGFASEQQLAKVRGNVSNDVQKAPAQCREDWFMYLAEDSIVSVPNLLIEYQMSTWSNDRTSDWARSLKSSLSLESWLHDFLKPFFGVSGYVSDILSCLATNHIFLIALGYSVCREVPGGKRSGEASEGQISREGRDVEQSLPGTTFSPLQFKNQTVIFRDVLCRGRKKIQLNSVMKGHRYCDHKFSLAYSRIHVIKAKIFMSTGVRSYCWIL